MCPSDGPRVPEKPVAAWEIFGRCWRCNGPIDGESVFAVRIWADKHGMLAYDVERARDLRREDMAIHMGGDRKCGKPISGWHGKILERLDLPMSTDTSFLDRV